MAKTPRRSSKKTPTRRTPRSRMDTVLSKLGPEGKADYARAARADSFKNVATGLGVATRDKRESTSFEIDALTLDQLEGLYRAEDVSARIVDAPVEAAFRQGFEVVIEGDKDRSQSEEIMARLDELGVAGQLEEAAKFARALGGSGLLLGADDGSDAEEPLDLEGIKAFSWLTLFTPRELMVERYYEDPEHPSFGKPELYRTCNITATGANAMSAGGKLIHESRIIRFDGQPVSNRILRTQRGWADSVLLRPYKVIRDFNVGWSAVSYMLSEFSQALLKVKGLAEIIAENGDAEISKRASAMNISRSVAGVLLLDSEEDFSRDTVSLAGVPETLKEMLGRLAMAARMPVTVLAGVSPAGLNATGESDITQWYDTVKAWQMKSLLPALNIVVRCAFLDPAGPTKGKEPENWSVQFNPLWQLTEKETVELRNKQAMTDQVYINAGVLLPEEVAVARFGGDAYSTETKLDMEARAEAEKMAEAEAEAQAAAQEAGAPPKGGAPGKKPGEAEGKVLPFKKDEAEDVELGVMDNTGDALEGVSQGLWEKAGEADSWDEFSDEELAELGLTRAEVAPLLPKAEAERADRLDSADADEVRFDKSEAWKLVERNEKGQFVAKGIDSVIGEVLAKEYGATAEKVQAAIAGKSLEQKKEYLLFLAQDSKIALDPAKVAKLTESKPAGEPVAIAAPASAPGEAPGKPASDYEAAKLAVKAGLPLPPGLKLSAAQKAVLTKAAQKAAGKAIEPLPVAPEPAQEVTAPSAPALSSFEAAKAAIASGQPMPQGMTLTAGQKAVLTKMLKAQKASLQAELATAKAELSAGAANVVAAGAAMKGADYEAEQKAEMIAASESKLQAAKEHLKAEGIEVGNLVHEEAFKTASTFLKDGAPKEGVEEWLNHLESGDEDAAQEVKEQLEAYVEAKEKGTLLPDEPEPAPAPAAKLEGAPPPPLPGVNTDIDTEGPPIAPVGIDGWQQVGPQKGSNPGGTFEDENGQKFYVKFRSAEHAKNEVLASMLYQAAGIPAPELKLIEKDGKVGVASRLLEGEVGQGNLGAITGVHEGFAADAWLANWDAVGMTSDNILVGKDGVGRRIDLGGSLLYRAQGKAKGGAFGDTVGELESLKSSGTNPSGAKAFGSISEDAIAQGAERIAAIPDEKIHAIVEKYGPGDAADKISLANKLIARKNDLVSKALSEEYQTKKALGPELVKEHQALKAESPEHAKQFLSAAKAGASPDELKGIVEKGKAHAAEEAKKSGFVAIEAKIHALEAAEKTVTNAGTEGVQSKEEFAKSLGYDIASLSAGQKAAITKKFNALKGQGAVTTPVKHSVEWSNLKAEIAEAAAQKSSAKFKSTIKQLGGDGDQAVHMLSQWKGSSTSQGAMELRSAVAFALGEQGHDTASLLQKDFESYKAVKGSYSSADTLKSYFDQASEKGKASVKTLKAMASQAQTLYPADHHTFYRGIGGPQADLVRKMVKEAKAAGKTHVRVNTGLVASWAETKGKASNFGNLILKAKVPRQAILASDRLTTSGMSHTHEAEVMLMSSGSVTIHVDDILD